MGATPNVLVKNLGQFKGLQDIYNENAKEAEAATVANNTLVSYKGTLTSRPGIKPTATVLSANAAWQIIPFRYTDFFTRTPANQLLVLGAAGLYKLDPVSITITNSTGANISVNLSYDSVSGLHKLTILNNVGASLLTYSLETVSQASDVTIATMISAINAIGGLVAVATGNTTGAAALLDNLTTTTVADAGTVVLKGRNITAVVNQSSAFPAYTLSSNANQNDETAEIPHWTTLNNALYITDKTTGLWKYDGYGFYRAGMGISTVPQAALSLGGTGITGRYSYVAVLERFDAAGNLVTSQPAWSADYGLSSNNVVNPANQTVTIDLTQIVAKNIANSPSYLNGQALQWARGISGTQNTGVNKFFDVVTATGSIVAGQVVAVQASNGSGAFRALIFSVSSITVGGGSGGSDRVNIGSIARAFDMTLGLMGDPTTVQAPTAVVASDAGVSSGVFVALYRTKDLAAGAVTSTTPFYLVGRRPYVLGGTTYTIADATTDANLGAVLEVPNPPAALFSSFPAAYTATAYRVNSIASYFPPRAKYITTVQDRLYLGNIENSENSVIASSLEWGPEFFWPDYRDELEQTTSQDALSVVGGLSSVLDKAVIFKTGSIRIIDGVVGTEQQRVYTISKEAGLVGGHAIAPFKNTSLAYLSDNGVYVIGAGGPPQLLDTSPISPYLYANNVDLRRAVMTSDLERSLLYVYLPYTTDKLNSLHNLSPSSNLLLVYDFAPGRNAWHVYTGSMVNARGGMCMYDDRLFMLAQTYSSGMKGIPVRMLDRDVDVNYVDWTAAINWEFSTTWLNLGEPDQLKKILTIAAERIGPDALTCAHAADLTCVLEIDWKDGTTRSSFPLSLSTLNRDVKTPLPTNFRAARLRFTSAALKKQPLLSNITVELSLPFKPKIKKS